MTCIKPRTSWKKGPTIAELRPLDCQNGHYYLVNSIASSFFFSFWIFMKLANSNDMHRISDKFGKGSDRTNDGRVIFP